MAIIIEGKTTCSICNETLQPNDKFIGFPAFVSNTKDDLYLFNDAGVHAACFESHPKKEKVDHYVGLHLSKSEFSEKVCCVTNEPITNPDDYVFTGCLSSDENEEVSRFNFITINRNNIGRWGDREAFVKALTEFKNSGKWEAYSSFDLLSHFLELASN